MKNNIKSPAANQTEVTLANGNVLFYSYATPVAAFVSGRGILRTSKKWSASTSKHITQFIKRNAPSATVTEVDQSVFDVMGIWE